MGPFASNELSIEVWGSRSSVRLWLSCAHILVDGILLLFPRWFGRNNIMSTDTNWSDLCDETWCAVSYKVMFCDVLWIYKMPHDAIIMSCDIKSCYMISCGVIWYYKSYDVIWYGREFRERLWSWALVTMKESLFSDNGECVRACVYLRTTVNLVHVRVCLCIATLIWSVVSCVHHAWIVGIYRNLQVSRKKEGTCPDPWLRYYK